MEGFARYLTWKTYGLLGRMFYPSVIRILSLQGNAKHSRFFFLIWRKEEFYVVGFQNRLIM